MAGHFRKSLTINGCNRRWYGKTKEHKKLIQENKNLPPWQSVDIRCHDFRVTYCTMCYEAGIPIKTLQAWMGHSDPSMIMNIYAKLTSEKEQADAATINEFMKNRFKKE
ncbi:MAG: tyrosine-type recombinase/integrase [Clostridia bacterium]|nr:tyrosine-type recombinase/integrase [Acidaminococcaceae bacterium]MBR6965839.1 tyrosine-type recombinase/integrase [Clostridia bacterium]